MQISTEGKVGIGLGLLAMAGGGAAVKWPTHDEIGIAMMAFAAIGGMLLAINHFGLSGRWRMFPFGRADISFRGTVVRPDWGVRIVPSPPKRWWRPVTKTHPYDVPTKLAMIDDLLTVLNSEFPKVSAKGINIAKNAFAYFRNNEKDKLNTDLNDLLALTEGAENSIMTIVREGAKFEDIVEIVGYRDYISRWFRGITSLKKDIELPGFDPDQHAGHYQSVVNLFFNGQLEMNRWALHTRQALLQHRKRVVSGKA
jgi:hypothetical protein